jgi:hypothetical protein
LHFEWILTLNLPMEQAVKKDRLAPVYVWVRLSGMVALPVEQALDSLLAGDGTPAPAALAG